MKVVISGTACSGKTTTIQFLEMAGYRTVPEAPTAYIEEQQKLNLSMNEILSDLVNFEREVIKRQLHAEKSTDLNGDNVLFLDRSLVDVVAFCRMLSIAEIEDEVSAHIENAQYSLVFILEKLPFEKTGTRWENTEEQADIQDTYLRDAYLKYGFQFIHVPVMSAEERTDFIIQKITGYQKNKLVDNLHKTKTKIFVHRYFNGKFMSLDTHLPKIPQLQTNANLTVSVFCGADQGTDVEYVKMAQTLGELFVKNKISLVYGGGNVGLMGAISNSVLDGNGCVIGVIPHVMKERCWDNPRVTDMRVVDSMLDRKTVMFDLSDASIALPGGIGTLAELFHVWDDVKSDLHDMRKPFAVLNVNHYFDPLIDFISHMVKSGFLNQQDQDLLIIDDDCERLVKKLMDQINGSRSLNKKATPIFKNQIPESVLE